MILQLIVIFCGGNHFSVGIFWIFIKEHLPLRRIHIKFIGSMIHTVTLDSLSGLRLINVVVVSLQA
jgi:hypothetical protein